MDCLQLSITPLPQLITVGHSRWKPGMQHFQRKFRVYDMLFVNKGTLYMSEEGTAYDIGESEMLVLEPDRTHWGHKPCAEETDIYWVHFVHSAPVRRVPDRHIAWQSVIRQGTDQDLSPAEQYMFLPKYAKIDLKRIVPVLEQMVSLRSALCTENALQLQAMLAHLFTLLQAAARTRESSRSFAISEMVKRYLQERYAAPVRAIELEKRFHYHFDYLARCLKKHTGMSPLKYVQYVRMEEAKSLLANTHLSLPDIAERVGMKDYNYFVRLFRQTVGMPPASYRRYKQGYTS